MAKQSFDKKRLRAADENFSAKNYGQTKFLGKYDQKGTKKGEKCILIDINLQNNNLLLIKNLFWGKYALNIHPPPPPIFVEKESLTTPINLFLMTYFTQRGVISNIVSCIFASTHFINVRHPFLFLGGRGRVDCEGLPPRADQPTVLKLGLVFQRFQLYLE